MSAQTEKVASAQQPDSELVRLLAEGLQHAGFVIVDVKDHALLVKAGKREMMIGVKSV